MLDMLDAQATARRQLSSDFSDQALFGISEGSQHLLSFDNRRPAEQVAIEQEAVVPVAFLVNKADALCAVEKISDLSIGEFVAPKRRSAPKPRPVE